MKTLLLLCGFFLVGNGIAIANSDVPKPGKTKAGQIETTVEQTPDFTAYGRMVASFYSDGRVKKVRCKSPYTVICFTVDYPTGKIELHPYGFSGPPDVIYPASFQIGVEEGETVIDFTW